MVSYLQVIISLNILTVCLNPYCSGQWSHTVHFVNEVAPLHCLNPYCSGQWSHTVWDEFDIKFLKVLILIVVDNGLVQLKLIVVLLLY